MAKGTLSWDFATGLTGLYNALNSLGFITAVCGTPSSTSLIFTGPLCKTGTYIRVRLNSTSLTTNNPIGFDIGTVSGSTFTPVRDIFAYTNTNADLAVSRYDLYYDTALNILVFARSNTTTYGEVLLLCATDTGLKLGCIFQNTQGSNSRGFIPINASVTTDYYVLANPFDFTLKIGGQYLEQEIYLALFNTSEVLMNGTVPDKLNGVTNISMLWAALFAASTDWVLFGNNYMESSQDVKYNLTTYLKVSLLTE